MALPDTKERFGQSIQSLIPDELHFGRSNGVIDETLDMLLDMLPDIEHRDIVHEMLLAALKAGTESDSRADLKLMNTTLKEMRYTAKVFAPYRDTVKVTVFGSARTRPEEAPVHMVSSHPSGRVVGIIDLKGHFRVDTSREARARHDRVLGG